MALYGRGAALQYFRVCSTQKKRTRTHARTGVREFAAVPSTLGAEAAPLLSGATKAKEMIRAHYALSFFANENLVTSFAEREVCRLIMKWETCHLHNARYATFACRAFNWLLAGYVEFLSKPPQDSNSTGSQILRLFILRPRSCSSRCTSCFIAKNSLPFVLF